MKTINLSKIKSGAEFANIINNCGENIFQLIGEEYNPVLNLINEPETTPKFKIGDQVQFNQKLLDFNGVSQNSRYFIRGMEMVGDQFLYACYQGNKRFEFFGYELEKIE